MSKASNIMRLVLLQLKGSSDKTANVLNAVSKIEAAVKEHQPRLITLPECFNSPYGTKYFREHAEQIPNGYTSQQLSKAALANQIYIVGGTIPELGENDAIYNTCTVWGPTGELIAKHRKMHLFDIDVKGGIRFKESDTLSAGNDFTVINVDGHKIGIGICYDIRFEEMARLYRNDGCEMIIYPAAFNMTTGPLHWELLQRARANDNQLFVVTTSPARDTSADYVAYGHSMIVDPWAKVQSSAGEGEQILAVNIDFSLVEQVRQQIPVFSQRRLDLYSTDKKSK
ncbi:omega-amidase NIT2 [Drosophila grimshawi]|uniref:omega-amidase n=1 Tax=Drosophila grimshawi TaxID=7222 RepID=B4JI62_DROGR|nr:omega-amidase NIT2 [Drosophila grimshawi]EDV92943.1 GH19038 [Drosophila grimshawi]